MSNFLIYDFYIFGIIALLGTIITAVWLLWFFRRPRVKAMVQSCHGIEPPLISVIGMLFGLALAFLANDTWNAQDRAIAAVNRESGALHGMIVLANRLPPEQRREVRLAARDYAQAVIDEWPMIARHRTSREADLAEDRLLNVFTSRQVSAVATAETARAGMEMVMTIRDGRETRVSLSQTHVNPLKWAVMAFLGFATMLAIALVHVTTPRAMLVSVGLFALTSAPTAAVVLIHGNPFQQPLAVSPTPLGAAVGVSVAVDGVK